ncbi:MAG: amidohydrolase [Thermincolia bacterium]
MSKILIKNAVILPMTGRENLIEKGEIAIQDGKIMHIAPVGSLAADWQADEIIDATGQLAMPGFINCHTHAAMTLLRSYADDLPLMEWLSEKIWPIEDKLTGEDVYWGTMLSIAEMIKSGTTTFLDMYFFMDQVGKAVEDSGIRAVLSRGLIGFNPNAEMALAESRELVEQYDQRANGRLSVVLGPHAPYTCPPEYLKKVMALADELGVGIHIHVAETQTEIEGIAKDHGKTPTQYLNDLGLFDGRRVIAAHCVHMIQEDLEIFKNKQVGVAHNPESNMKLASGIAPVPKMLEMGILVGLGTDGASSNNNLDMLQEMRSAALLHKVNSGDPTILPAYQALEMATVNGAKVLGLDQEVGILKIGYKADLILLDLEQPHLYPRHDVVANVVYAAQAADVRTVIIDGQIVMKDRKLLTMDEPKVLAEAQRCTESLLARSKEK